MLHLYYALQGKVMFSKTSVILSTIGLKATRSLLILVTARSLRILLECFLVWDIYSFRVEETKMSGKSSGVGARIKFREVVDPLSFLLH